MHICVLPLYISKVFIFQFIPHTYLAGFSIISTHTRALQLLQIYAFTKNPFMRYRYIWAIRCGRQRWRRCYRVVQYISVYVFHLLFPLILSPASAYCADPKNALRKSAAFVCECIFVKFKYKYIEIRISGIDVAFEEYYMMLFIYKYWNLGNYMGDMAKLWRKAGANCIFVII